jgi:hypothetical protein
MLAVTSPEALMDRVRERDRSTRFLICPGGAQRASAVANELIWRMKEVGYRPAKYRVDVPALVIHGDEPINETYR